LTAKAEDDLVGIFAFTVQQWSVEQAFLYLSKMREAMRLLGPTPSMGRSCDDLRAGLRRFEHNKHVLFYLFNAERVLVVRVLHQAQIPKRKHFRDIS